MTARAVHIPDPAPADAAGGDEGLRRVRALRKMAERGLVHGDADERVQAARLLGYLDTAEVEGGLETALGLGGPGWTGALRRYRQSRRNRALRALWRDACPDLSVAAAARLIAARWRLCEARRARGAEAPPARLDAALDRLLDAGHRPLAASTIRGVLSGDVDDLHGLEAHNPTGDLGHERSASHET